MDGIKFADTSTAESAGEAPIGNPEEGAQNIPDLDSLLPNMDFGESEESLPNTVTTPVAPTAPPATPKEGKPATTGTPDNDEATPDYKAAYVNWMKEKGETVDPDDLGDDFDLNKMNSKVEEYHAKNFVKDPLLFQLAKSGLSIEDHLQNIAPLQETLKLDDKALYTRNKVAELFENDVKLGKVDKTDEAAVKAALTAHQATVSKTVENVDEAILKGLVDPMRAQITNQINELPSKIQELKTQAFEAERTKAIAEYETTHTQAVADVEKELNSGNNFGIPFKDQDEKGDFKNYYSEQLKYQEITVKGEDGKESKVQDIPFWHRLNNDPKTLNKVLRVMHALEKGTLTDIKNTTTKKAVNKLGLEPLVVDLSGGKNTQTSIFADTSKEH